MVDQPLHHLRADGAFLVLGKDVPSRFLGGELCGPLKDEGFYEGSILFFFPKPIWSSRRCRYSLALWLFHFFIHSFRPFYALSLSPTESVASHGKP
jgi:hypothetical protein